MYVIEDTYRFAGEKPDVQRLQRDLVAAIVDLSKEHNCTVLGSWFAEVDPHDIKI